jgi:UDP-GlcNAc:undecaprenyl-phosphate GlcNAc-1-phosphate transferase
MNTYILYTILSLFVSAACGFIFTPMILNFCKHKGLYDIPNKRKVHKNAIPRLGGITFTPCMLAAFIIATTSAQFNEGNTITLSLWSLYFLVGLTAIYITGIIDDIVGLPAMTKLIVQLAAAITLPVSGLYINNLYGFCGITEIPYYIGMPLTVIVVAFIANAFNLIDGIDGLSGGLALISLAGFLYSFAEWELWYYTVLIAGLMGVLVAFLFFNIFGNEKKNRKIFMGDTGSLSIGFIIAFLSIKFAMDNQMVMPYRRNCLLLSYTLLIIPVFDVFRVVMVRLRNHRAPFLPDKNHIHHKLMRSGFTQHQALVIILAFALVYVVMNYLLIHVITISKTVVIDIVVYFGFHLLLDRRIRKRGRKAEEFE